MAVDPKERQRATRGSFQEGGEQVGARYLLKLPAKLAKRVKAAAKRDGVSLAVWWRGAAEAKLEAKP